MTQGVRDRDAVELPAHDAGVEDGVLPRRRQHGGAEAGAGDAADVAQVRRAGGEGRVPGGRHQHPAGLRCEGRRGKVPGAWWVGCGGESVRVCGRVRAVGRIRRQLPRVFAQGGGCRVSKRASEPAWVEWRMCGWVVSLYHKCVILHKLQNKLPLLFRGQACTRRCSALFGLRGTENHTANIVCWTRG